MIYERKINPGQYSAFLLKRDDPVFYNTLILLYLLKAVLFAERFLKINAINPL